jgi:hypothetical protein
MSAELLYFGKYTVTAATGTVSFNTLNLRGILRTVIVSPATSTTQWDLTITNAEGLDVYENTSVTGDIADELAYPLKGVYTLTIANATVDEEFKIQLGMSA